MTEQMRAKAIEMTPRTEARSLQYFDNQSFIEKKNPTKSYYLHILLPKKYIFILLKKNVFYFCSITFIILAYIYFNFSSILATRKNLLHIVGTIMSMTRFTPQHP